MIGNAEKKKRKKAERELIDVSSFPHDEKGNAIVPDTFFIENLKQLPDGTYNESRTYRAYNGGRLYQIGSDPEKDKEVTRAGADASNATQAERKSFSELFDIWLRKKDDSGMTYAEKITLAMMEKAGAGDSRAAVFVRDTCGEMPTTKTQVTADIMTEADRALIEKLSKRVDR